MGRDTLGIDSPKFSIIGCDNQVTAENTRRIEREASPQMTTTSRQGHPGIDNGLAVIRHPNDLPILPIPGEDVPGDETTQIIGSSRSHIDLITHSKKRRELGQ